MQRELRALCSIDQTGPVKLCVCCRAGYRTASVQRDIAAPYKAAPGASNNM